MQTQKQFRQEKKIEHFLKEFDWLHLRQLMKKKKPKDTNRTMSGIIFVQIPQNSNQSRQVVKSKIYSNLPSYVNIVCKQQNIKTLTFEQFMNKLTSGVFCPLIKHSKINANDTTL